MQLVPFSDRTPEDIKNSLCGIGNSNPLKSCWKLKSAIAHGLTPLLYVKDVNYGEGYYCIIITAPLHDMKGGYPKFEMESMRAEDIIARWELMPFQEFSKEIINRLNNVFDFLF